MANNVNLIKLYFKNNNSVIIPVSDLPVFDFSLVDNTDNNYFIVKMRISKNENSNIDNTQPFKYDYLREIWNEIKQYSTSDIEKIEIIQDDVIAYTMTNVIKVYYQIDFLDRQLGEFLEFTMRK